MYYTPLASIWMILVSRSGIIEPRDIPKIDGKGVKRRTHHVSMHHVSMHHVYYLREKIKTQPIYVQAIFSQIAIDESFPKK